MLILSLSLVAAAVSGALSQSLTPGAPCPPGGGDFCVSSFSNIILRCSTNGTDGVLVAGNCNDNLAGVPPVGVKTDAICGNSTVNNADCFLPPYPPFIVNPNTSTTTTTTSTSTSASTSSSTSASGSAPCPAPAPSAPAPAPAPSAPAPAPAPASTGSTNSTLTTTTSETGTQTTPSPTTSTSSSTTISSSTSAIPTFTSGIGKMIVPVSGVCGVVVAMVFGLF